MQMKQASSKQAATKVNDKTKPNANGTEHVKQVVATKVNNETTPNANKAGHVKQVATKRKQHANGACHGKQVAPKVNDVENKLRQK